MRVTILILITFAFLIPSIYSWGFQHHIDVDKTSKNGALTNFWDKKIRSYHVNFYVDELTNLEEVVKKVFNLAMKEKIKLVVRFCYRKHTVVDQKLAFSIADRMVPILKQYKSIIMVVDAGLLGPWGEWHSYSLSPDTDHGKNALVSATKRGIIERWCSTGLNVAVRYPREKKLYAPKGCNVGIHNDCILANGPGGNDAGTFDKGTTPAEDNNIKAVQQWLISTGNPFYGGESCEEGKGAPTCEQVLTYAKLFKMTYYNLDFPAPIKNFREPCYSQLQNVMLDNVKAQGIKTA